MAKYLIRFDDINPRMNFERFLDLKLILEKNNIKSILGVIPDCKDREFLNFAYNKSFIKLIKKFKDYGDTIAQHGYQHIYDSKERGIFGSGKNSEFAGLDFKTQLVRLKSGKDILIKHSLWEPVFMAPAHSFDFNTLKALQNLSFKYVLDGFALYPYDKKNLIFIPQIISKPLPKFITGVSQLCIHINTISDDEIKKLKKFIAENKSDFITLEESINYKKIGFYSIIDQFAINLLIRNFRKIRSFFYLFRLKNIFNKSRCMVERIKYKFLLYNYDIDPWHLKGTFQCRIYKKFVYKLVIEFKPSLYIDIGCGLGEILSKVKLNSNKKIGLDIGKGIEKAVRKINKNKFIFFGNEKNLLDYFSTINNEKKIVITMLNFCHNISNADLVKRLKIYEERLGRYILIIDNIFIRSKEYRYDHHDFLYSHKGLIAYHDKVDNLRSIYVLKIG